MFASVVLPHLAPISSVRRNLLVAATLALAISFLSVDASGFNFLGISFQEDALRIALLVANVFYLFGYIVKISALWFVIANDSADKQMGLIDKMNELINALPLDYTSAPGGGMGSTSPDPEGKRAIENSFKNSSRNEKLVGGLMFFSEIGTPILLSLIGIVGLIFWWS